MSLLYSLNAREAIRIELTEKSVVSGRDSLHPVPRLEIGLTSRHSATLQPSGAKTLHFSEPSALYSSHQSESADGPLALKCNADLGRSDLRLTFVCTYVGARCGSTGARIYLCRLSERRGGRFTS